MRKELFLIPIVISLTAGCISITRQETVTPVRQQPQIVMPPAPASDLTAIPASSPSLKTGKDAGSFALVRIPPYKSELKGSNEIRLRNPNNFPVLVMIRRDEQGRNIEIPGKSMTLVYLPDGGFQVSFVFANVPNAVLRGDHIHLPSINRPDIGIPISENR